METQKDTITKDESPQKNSPVINKPKNLLTAEEEHSEGFYSQETLDQGKMFKPSYIFLVVVDQLLPWDQYTSS